MEGKKMLLKFTFRLPAIFTAHDFNPGFYGYLHRQALRSHVHREENLAAVQRESTHFSEDKQQCTLTFTL